MNGLGLVRWTVENAGHAVGAVDRHRESGFLALPAHGTSGPEHGSGQVVAGRRARADRRQDRAALANNSDASRVDARERRAFCTQEVAGSVEQPLDATRRIDLGSDLDDTGIKLQPGLLLLARPFWALRRSVLVSALTD